jgi:hypothetical protein
MPNLVNITKEKFQSYIDVQKSGVTNMFDLSNVMPLSGLSKAECIDIMQNYVTYKKQFNIED